MATTLHLVIPGLLQPGPYQQAAGLPAVPHLARLLSRAEQATLPVQGFAATLCYLFGIAITSDNSPLAALTGLADGVNTEAGYWLRADPVYLHADLQQVLLFDARALSVTQQEAQALVAAINQLLSADGLQLQALQTERWYLHLSNAPDLQTQPLDDVIGKNINALLPSGADSQYWCTLLTEIQMLLYNQNINIRREQQRQRPVNSVWFWGGGYLPDTITTSINEVFAADPLSRGLARCANLALSSIPDNCDDWLQASTEQGDILLVSTALQYSALDDDFEHWCEQFDYFHEQWFTGLKQLLQQKTLAALRVYPCDGRVFTVTGRKLRRFWQRSHPFSRFMQ